MLSICKSFTNSHFVTASIEVYDGTYNCYGSNECGYPDI